jgi:hypothetical protein
MYNESITNFFIKYVLILYFGVLYDIPDECGPYLYKTIHKHRWFISDENEWSSELYEWTNIMVMRGRSLFFCV